jgi:glycosyltransferase involved in cell wall biosynthesis
MRLAVFTAAFPGRINTFFARDMSALIRAGIEIDIFPIYPLQPEFWSEVPDCLNDAVLPRDRVHHVGLLEGLRPGGRPWAERWRFLGDTMRVRASAARFGPETFAKSEYVFLKAWTWARDRAAAIPDEHGGHGGHGGYDHVLSYWGNYAATAAYLFHRQCDRDIPFSIVLHAHDLYSRQVFLRQKLLHADNIIVVCEYNRRYLASHYGDIYPRLAEKIHLHHLGLDVDAITPTFTGRRPHTCLTVGRLDPSKGFDDVLRAAALVHGRGIDIEVALVGDGEQAAMLRRLAASLGIADRVDFRGWLPFDAVPAAMREATLLVHPSCGHGDAVPTVIKEAMALGTPVIGSDAVGVPELLDQGRCGLVVPERNVEALADAMTRMLADANLRDRLARAGRAFTERTFHLWRNGQRLADLLRSTRRGPAGRRSQAA